MFWIQKILYGSEWPVLEVKRVKEPKSTKIILGPDSVADFYYSWIPDLVSRIQEQQQKRKGEKLLSNIFCSHIFTKFEIILFLNRNRKKFEPINKEPALQHQYLDFN